MNSSSSALPVADKDRDRIWIPPKDPDIATYMSVVLTTPLYTWAIGPDGRRHRVLLDSGSAISLISDISGIRSARDFKLDESTHPITVRGVDPGSTLRSRGTVAFPLKFPVQEFIGAKLFSDKDSRNAYTIQRGPVEGEDKRIVFPVDDTRTHVHLEFKGYYFDSAGCGILMGMDLLSRESQGANWATPAGFDFRNGSVLFRTPRSPMHSEDQPMDFGTACVPTYYSAPSNEKVESSRPVLVVNVHETSIPPGHTAQVRCAGQCGYMPKDSMCTVIPHSKLAKTTSARCRDTPLAIGPEQYMLGLFVPDPRLFTKTQEIRSHDKEVIRHSCPTPQLKSSQRYQKARCKSSHSKEDQLKNLHKGLRGEIQENRTQDCGLMVEFPNSGTLIYWSQLDNSTKGKADIDFHVKVTNTSPVEMILLAGQPIAEATTASYWDPQRNIAEVIKQPSIGKGISKALKCAGDMSTMDVDVLTQLLHQKQEKHHPMQVLLEAQVPNAEWIRPTDVEHVLTEPDAVFKVETVCAMVKIQRGVIIEFLMTLIHCTDGHRVDGFGDELEEEIYGRSRSGRWREVNERFHTLRPDNKGELGKLRFVLGIHKLLYRFPGLIISVLADMMNRHDTCQQLSEMLLSCAKPLAMNLISEETQQCNFENLLIIERWTENMKRAIRITPIKDQDLLEGFEFPLYNGTGQRAPYTSRQQTYIDLHIYPGSLEGRSYTTERLVEALSGIISDSNIRRDRVMAVTQVNLIQSENSGHVPTPSAGYACLSLQTLVVSVQDNQLQDLMTINNPRAQEIHQICKIEECRRLGSASQQYTRDSSAKVDHSERVKAEQKIRREGLVGVQPTLSGMDTIDGPTEELTTSLEKLWTHQSTSQRNIEEENERGEAIDPALGGDPSNVDQGYHFDRALTDEEYETQLQIEEDRLKSQPWYDSRISRPVTGKDEEGNSITMPWYKWTLTQAWRQLRELEPEETVRGEDHRSMLYTLRSVLDVGLPDDEELEKMGLVTEDRLLMGESLWRMAPCFYHGPNHLPAIRHFSFTRMFMSLVTDVPYRQKPLVIPVHAEELVYTSIRAMIKDGVVEASLSAYNNGLLLVAKKPSRPGAPASGMRVVLDARGLNHITRRVNWPIEDLSLCLREVAGAAFITVTDVLSGFHLIPLDPECRPPTAFTCGSLGHLQYCRAGMGMANSPARFASVLSGVLGLLRHNACGQGHNREGNDYAPYPHSGACSSADMLKNTEIGTTEEQTEKFNERRTLWKKCVTAKIMDQFVEADFTLHRCLCIVYVDDVTIATWYDRSEGKPDHQMEQLQLKQHLRDVEKVLKRMRQFGIVCKPVKTEIARPCNELLGYIVGRDGLRANPKKVEKLMDIDLPRSKEGLNFFIGLAGFYRQFIPRLSVLEAPLRKLLNHPGLPNTVKDVNDHTIPACWDEVEGQETITPMEAFKAIIMELAKFTALSSIDYRPQAGRVGIAADASRYGLAAVLFQETVCGTDKDGRQLYRERPICYWSKALVAKDQSAYPYDRELAAITLAVRNWHKYILGRRILIVSDHQPLDYMLEPKRNSKSEKKQSSRLLWLIMELARYDVIVSWRAGKWIPHADALSRILKVGRIISLTTKPTIESEPHAYNQESCDRISLVCGEVPYTKEDQAASMIDGDEAERVWLADTSDNKAAIQSVVANPDLWHVAKADILEDMKKHDHPLVGRNEDEMYLGYIEAAKECMEFATNCKAKGRGFCTPEEWTKYLEIAEAIGVDPDQRSDTLTPFRHIATGGVRRGDVAHQKGWIQIAQGREWSLSDKIPCSSENTDVMQLMTDTDNEEVHGMDEEDTTTYKLFQCHVTTDHRHEATLNLDPLYKKVMEEFTQVELTERTEESVPSYILLKNPYFFDEDGQEKEKSSVTNALIARAQLFDSYYSQAYEDTASENIGESVNQCTTEDKIEELTSHSCANVKDDAIEHLERTSVPHVNVTQLIPTTPSHNEEEERITQMIEDHIHMIQTEEAVEMELDVNEGDEERPAEIDADVNFTKVDTANIRKLWAEKDKADIVHYEKTKRPIVISWHNVNGIGSFIKHLRVEGASYFQPKELYPDIFGILEAKVSQSRPESVALITVLQDLIEELTGHIYVEVRSIRRSTSRCGTIVFMKASFLETREWWTWSSDLEVYDPSYMNTQSAGYVCKARELDSHNGWDRRPVGDGDGRVVQIVIGPDKRSDCSSKDQAALRILVVYTRNSSSGLGDSTARVNFDELLYQTVFALPNLPTIIVGDLNVCPEEEDVMSPTEYKKDQNTIIGCLPHERQGAQQFIESGMTSNNILDRQAGVEIGHTAGGMGAVTTRHWLQLFNLDRALLRLVKYISTSYKSLSIRGKGVTQTSVDRTRQQSQLTELMTGSDHTQQRIIIEEIELQENRLEPASALNFNRPNDRKWIPIKFNKEEYSVIMSLVLAREMWDEAAYAMSFPYESEEAQIIWAGLGYRQRKNHPTTRKRVVNFRYRKASLAHRWMGVAPWFKPLPQWWTKRQPVTLCEGNQGRSDIPRVSLNDYLHRLVHDLHILHKNGYVEQRSRKELQKIQMLRISTHPLAVSYVSSYTSRYRILSVSSKNDPNRAPCTNPWKMGSMIFQPKSSIIQKATTSIACPGITLVPDHYTNERYVQIMENTMSGNQSGSFGTTRSKDASGYPYRSQLGPVETGLRRFPGESGGRSGLQYMAYAKYMYVMSEMITTARGCTEEDNDPFRTYHRPLTEITQTINSLVARCDIQRPDIEQCKDAISACVLLAALRNAVRMYLFRTGVWTEYNTVFGNRLAEIGRSNHCIPPTPTLIDKVNRCLKRIRPMYDCLDELILFYHCYNEARELEPRENENNKSIASEVDYGRPKARTLHYKWHRMSELYQLFRPVYTGDNKERRRLVSLEQKRWETTNERLGLSLRWEEDEERCKCRISNTRAPIRDLHGDASGIIRTTTRTIVDDRSKMFNKAVRAEVFDKAEVIPDNHTRATGEGKQSQPSSTPAPPRYDEQISKSPTSTSIQKQSSVIRSERWMITWTRLSTAPPFLFPAIDTYIKMDGNNIGWPEQTQLDSEKTRQKWREKKGIWNHVNWSAVSIREKTYLVDHVSVTKERLTVYVEFVFPVTEPDFRSLTQARFRRMQNHEEWQLKVRLWNGSDPIEQIHTRDPTSKVSLIHYKEVGQRTDSNHQSPNSSIGSSGRRPLASDPHALCSNHDCTDQWNTFMGKPSRKGFLPSCRNRCTNGKSRRKDKVVLPKAEVMVSEEIQGHRNKVQYCSCCTYPWEEASSEEADKDSLDVCTMLLLGSPDADQHRRDTQPINIKKGKELKKQSVQPILTLRKSNRTQGRKSKKYDCYVMDNPQKRTKQVKEQVARTEKSSHHELEKIIDEVTDEEGNSKFLCRWTGYDDTHNSWIADKDMSHARGLVKDWRTQNLMIEKSKQHRQNNPCGIQVNPGMVYTQDPKAGNKEVDITEGLGTNPSLDTQTPMTFQPQLESVASKMLRESAASTTANCPELKILLYLIRHGWRKSPQTDQMEHSQVYDKYCKYASVLKEVNGSIYRIRTEVADSADNEQVDRIRPPSCGRELQWIPPLKKRWSILLQTHATPDVGHPGAAVMLRRIQDVMWWPDITKHIKTMTDTCEICQHAKRRKDPLQGVISALRYKLPNSEILIDVIEGLPTARNGWKYIIAITCASSRYTMLIGSAKNNSEAIADALIHWIANAPGFPRMIKTGRDTGIVSAALQELLRRLTISNKTLNAWAPQLLGTQERTHTEVGNHMRIYCQADPAGWHTSLPWAQLVHNTSTHRMTGCTPLMLFKGNPCETLLTASYLPEQTSSIPVKNLAEDNLRFYYQLAKDARQKEFAIHNEHIRKYQEDFTKQKKSTESLAIGTRVLIFVPWVPAKLNEGLANRWHGPFKVMQCKGDSYFLQSTRTNHERNQWIKVSKSRVRKLIHLNEPVNVKSMLSDDKYMEPELSPWTAIIAGSTDLSDGENEVTIAPTAVTSILFKLDTIPKKDEEDTTNTSDIYQIWTQQCLSLLDRYQIYEENEHPKSSRNYITGDYITFIGCIRDNLEEAERLVDTLSSCLVAPIREIPRKGKTDKDSEVVRPDELTDEEIMNHYVLLPNHGQLKGRTLADIEGSSANFSTIIYCTAAGESLNHLRNWTSLNSSLLKRAPRNMESNEVSEEFTSKSRRIPKDTWIEMDTPTIPHSYKLLGSWHRYDKTSGTWDPVYGAPILQASQQHTEEDDHGVDYILMCREGRLSDQYPDELQFVLRWEGIHEDQYSVVARDQFFSELRDTFTSNQSIRLGDGYFISKRLNRLDDIQYLHQLSGQEGWPRNVVEYIEDQLHFATDAIRVEPTSNISVQSIEEEVHEERNYEEDLPDEWEAVKSCYWDEPGLVPDEVSEIYQMGSTEEPRQKWKEFGKKWSKTVHECNGEAIDVPIAKYYEFMQALWRNEEKESRKSTRITTKGEIRLVPNRPVSKGINIIFLSDKAVTMKGLHVDKEIMITMSGTQPEVVRGVIIENLKSPKGFMILIKERDRECILQTVSSLQEVSGELEPVERDTFGLQLDLLVANPEGKLTDVDTRNHILRHDGKRVTGKLLAHEEVDISTHSGLNNSQSEVVRWAGTLKGIGLLFGPPGTGKTHTAAEIIMEWARTNRLHEKTGAIFVIASSNVAVDALMKKFIDLLAKGHLNLNIGRLSSRTHSENIRNQPTLRKYDILQQVWDERKQRQNEDIPSQGSNEIGDLEDFLESSSLDLQTRNWIRQQMISKANTLQVIFTTVALAGSTILKEISMTQLLMEEAGATPEYSTVPALAKNPGTTLLIGDFMQLEAVIKCEEVKAILSQSLFQRLWFTDIPKRQLQLEYRLPGSVIPFFNDIVYNPAHGLQPIMVDPNHSERPLPEGLSISNPIVIIDSSSVSSRRGEGEETAVPQRGYYNQTEADTIVDMVEQLLRCIPGITAVCIGISAPYKMQIITIQERMRIRETWPLGFKVDQILIATADAFQGSEREFMFVSTVRTSYHGLKFAASLRRLNVILSRGSLVTFLISNGRVFGRSDLQPDHKHKPDTKEGLAALQRLFKWQGELQNVYNLDTWRRIFRGSVHSVTIINEEVEKRAEEGCKHKWEKLYYVTWKISILKLWLPKQVWTSIELIEDSWQQFRIVFQIANIRRILTDSMAYCTQLWIDNLIGAIGGPNPTRVVRDHNTVLTVQNPEVPVKGWPHLSYHRYPLLLLTILLNEKVTDKGLYRKQTMMLGIERGQREEEKPIHTDEEYKVSERSKRCMRGLYALTVLGLGIEDQRHKSKMDKSKITVIAPALEEPLHIPQTAEAKVKAVQEEVIGGAVARCKLCTETRYCSGCKAAEAERLKRYWDKGAVAERDAAAEAEAKVKAVQEERSIVGAVVGCKLCTDTQYCTGCKVAEEERLKYYWAHVQITEPTEAEVIVAAVAQAGSLLEQEVEMLKLETETLKKLSEEPSRQPPESRNRAWKVSDKYSYADGQMICIRLEPLRRLWAKNDRRNWDQINSYGECSVLKLRVQQLQWQMILYRYQTDKASKENAIKGNLNLLLVASLMTQLNQNWVHKEFLQHPIRIFEKNEPRLGKGRQLYVKRRWRSVYFRSSWMKGINRTNFAYKDASWAEQIRRYPWYRFVPLITWISTWEIGIAYLPTSSGKESWRNWPNPELNESIDITGNDKVWKDWSRKCGILMKERGHEFYEDQDIDNWWSHLQTINKREVLKWLLYDRPNYRWQRSTGAWNYYLGKIPGLKNCEPRTILQSRGRSMHYYESQVTTRQQYETSRNETTEECNEMEEIITPRIWDRYCREMSATRSYCQQLWPNEPVKGPGCNSLGNSTWVTKSKEDALEEQRKLCERIAHHKVGERKDGTVSFNKSTYIISPYACQEQNLPLFPDNEMDMTPIRPTKEVDKLTDKAIVKAKESYIGRYNVRVVSPWSSLTVGKRSTDTWLTLGVTPALMQIDPPGFISGPSQSSEVIYLQSGENACPQSQKRLLLRGLSRSHDVAQGVAVAKKYEDMSKLLGDEVLNQVGPLNHPAP